MKQKEIVVGGVYTDNKSRFRKVEKIYCDGFGDVYVNYCNMVSPSKYSTEGLCTNQSFARWAKLRCPNWEKPNGEKNGIN